MTRLLVTGASGFIGRHVLAALAGRADIEVIATARRRPADPPAGATWREFDLLDPTATGRALAELRPTHVLHLAWYAEHGRFWQARENLDWLRASVALLQAAADYGCRRFVGAGTCVEYDTALPGPYDELTTPCRPATLYGAAKHGFGLTLDRFGAATGLSSAWGRVFLPYGPGETAERLTPAIIRALLAGRAVALTHGRQRRDFMPVAALARAFIALLLAEVRGAVNLGAGRSVTVADHARRLAGLIGRPDLLRLGAVAAPDGDPAELTATTDRLAREVGFVTGDQDAALVETIAWWRQRPSS